MAALVPIGCGEKREGKKGHCAPHRERTPEEKKSPRGCAPNFTSLVKGGLRRDGKKEERGEKGKKKKKKKK